MDPNAFAQPASPQATAPQAADNAEEAPRKPVAVIEIDTVFHAVGAYRVLQNGLIDPGSQRYEALVQQANRIVAEALERVRIHNDLAHIMVAPLMAGHRDESTPDVTQLVVEEIAVVEILAWQRRRTSRRKRSVA